MTRDEAKAIVDKLVQRFAEHSEEYHLPEYNEQKTRQDFINPFFKALGWDIDNEKDASEAYREVIYEDKVVVRGKAKAPDYGFRLSGSGKKRLFFVEAKKPSVALKTNKESAYQLKRYGSSALADVSILTNFEDFIVYDCSRVPNVNDSASVSRLKHIHFADYLKEFDFIYDTFSHEAVTKGRFDKFVQSDTNKKGSQTLDKEFVQSLDQWRKYLATNIAGNNKKLDDEEINFAVQQTIDRLIFLRFCEDRAVEPYGQLQKAVSKGESYKNLFDLFKQADDKYNSGLFDFEKDQITPKLKIDNKVIKSVIEELYYPLCRYEFAVMPVEVLGNAYEQFLGKVIRITPARSVKIEEKPEVRKAGGVYYTPQYIVEYIVKNTVGKLIDGKTPKEIEKIKIVDPACGSGSFLLGAFDYLLQYHINWYHNNLSEAQRKKGTVFTPQGTLTTHEKKRILLCSIFGVDLDANAVEVTKLSLLLKCMEGETEASIKQQISLFHERVLPDLDNNIKSGNSLIDTDFYDSEIDLGYERKIKPFSWKKGFPAVFQKGGFDAVVGNPPWGADFPILSIEYIKKQYVSANEGSFDSYSAFVEKSISLLNLQGILGFITPDTFLRKDDFTTFRKFVFKNHSLIELIETGPVFSQVRDTWCAVFFIQKSEPINKSIVNHKKISRFVVSAEERLQLFGKGLWDKETFVPQAIWLKKEKMIVGYSATEKEQFVIDKIERFTKLELLGNFKISRGEEGSKYNILETKSGKFRMIIPADLQVNIVGEGKSISKEGLTPNKLSSIYTHPKIWITRIQKMRWERRIVSAMDKRINTAGMKTLQTITDTSDSLEQLNYLQAILSSRLIQFWCVNYLSDDLNQSYLSRIPIPFVNKNDTKKAAIRIDMASTIEFLQKLNLELIEANLEDKKYQIKRQIEHSEEKINRLVYELYDLSEEDIKVIEGQQEPSK